MSSCFCLLCIEPDAEQKRSSVCLRWHIKISVLGDAVFWGCVVLWAQLLAPLLGTCASCQGGGLWAGCLVFGPCSWGPGGGRPGLWQAWPLQISAATAASSVGLALWFHRAVVQPCAVSLSQRHYPMHPLPWQCDCWVTCEDESDEADYLGKCVGQADTHGPCFLLRGDGVSWYPFPNPCVILS